MNSSSSGIDVSPPNLSGSGDCASCGWPGPLYTLRWPKSLRPCEFFGSMPTIAFSTMRSGMRACSSLKFSIFMPPVQLILKLLPRHDDLLRVDDHDSVAHVAPRRERGLVLAQEDLGALGGHAAEAQPLRVHNVPLLRRRRGVGRLGVPSLLRRCRREGGHALL